jgi:hypothetical protein
LGLSSEAINNLALAINSFGNNKALIAAVIRETAAQELNTRIKAVLELRTPKNALYSREGPKKSSLTYVKIGYMEGIMRDHISADYQFRTITPPQLIADTRGGNPVYFCFLELDVRIFNQLVKTIPCQGTCDVNISKTGEYSNIETCIKGCVTDAMKKGLSFLGIANDVYSYGDSGELTADLVESFVKKLNLEFGSTFMDSVSPGFDRKAFLAQAQSVGGLRGRFWNLRDRYEEAKMKIIKTKMDPNMKIDAEVLAEGTEVKIEESQTDV